MKRILKILAITLFVICSLQNGICVSKQDKENKVPNIVFAIADDASVHMSAYGTSWVETPTFDKIASQGILFTNAYTPNAKCAPSRACILTGRNSWQLEELANHLAFWPADRYTTYVETLRENGYHVGRSGKGWAPGVIPEGRKLTGDFYVRGTLEDQFKAFLDDCPNEKPFHFWFGSKNPHRPYKFKSGVSINNRKLSDIDKIPPYWPDTDNVRHDMLDYAFEVEMFDDEVSVLYNELQKRGLLENTIIVVTSDHGMPFPRAKGDPYYESCHIPLAVMWKGALVNPGRISNEMVSTIDLTATFLEVAQVDSKSSGMKPVQGVSLTDILKNKKTENSHAEILLGRERNDVMVRLNNGGFPVRAIRKGDFFYIYNCDPNRWPSGETLRDNAGRSPTKDEVVAAGQESTYWQLCYAKREAAELYNVVDDPDCIVNLADKPEYAARVKSMHDILFDELKKQSDPRMFGKGYVFDQYPNCIWKTVYPKQRQYEKDNSFN